MTDESREQLIAAILGSFEFATFEELLGAAGPHRVFIDIQRPYSFASLARYAVASAIQEKWVSKLIEKLAERAPANPEWSTIQAALATPAAETPKVPAHRKERVRRWLVPTAVLTVLVIAGATTIAVYGCREVDEHKRIGVLMQELTTLENTQVSVPDQLRDCDLERVFPEGDYWAGMTVREMFQSIRDTAKDLLASIDRDTVVTNVHRSTYATLKRGLFKRVAILNAALERRGCGAETVAAYAALTRELRAIYSNFDKHQPAED